MSPSLPLTPAEIKRRKRHAERQKAYRKKLKERRKPTTEDIAIVAFRCLVSAKKTKKAQRAFAKLSDQIISELVVLGFNPVASRMAFDDLCDRFEEGAELNRGPNNRQGRPDISSYLPAKNERPHNSLSRGDTENRPDLAAVMEFQSAEKVGDLKIVHLSTVYLQPKDLELLLYESVFGTAFQVDVADTTLTVHLDWASGSQAEFATNRAQEGYSAFLCDLMTMAVEQHLDRVIFDRDGPVIEGLKIADH